MLIPNPRVLKHPVFQQLFIFHLRSPLSFSPDYASTIQLSIYILFPQGFNRMPFTVADQIGEITSMLKLFRLLFRTEFDVGTVSLKVNSSVFQ